MREIDYFDFLKSDNFDGKKHISLNVTYTLGGVCFEYGSSPNPSSLTEAVYMHFPMAEGPLEYQGLVLERALTNKNLGRFISFFGNRFYLNKNHLPSSLSNLKNISWLEDVHRSAAFNISIKHENDSFQRDRIIHKCTLTILFHKDFKTLERALEEKTLQLSKTKNAKDVKYQKNSSRGSAFPIQVKQQKYLITAKHVLNGFSGRVELKDIFGNAVYCNLGKQSKFDVQLLEPETPYTGPCFNLSEGSMELNDDIYVCGYPDKLGNRPTISSGHISKLNADFEGENGLIQLSSAAVNPNNSGGPVTDCNGNVVGVLTMRADKSDRLHNVAFAEPLKRALIDLGIL